MSELHNKNPEEFKEQDFRPQNKRDKLDIAMTIPRIIPITNIELKSIKKIGREYNIDTILVIIRKYDPELEKLLTTMTKKQISKPTSIDSIKKHITDFVNAASENKKFTLDIDKHDIAKKINLYQIFIDTTYENPKLVISIFNGQLLND